MQHLRFYRYYNRQLILLHNGFKKQTTFYLLIIVDVSASTEAFVGTVCLIAVRRSVSGRTGCRIYVGQLVRPLASLFIDLSCSFLTRAAVGYPGTR